MPVDPKFLYRTSAYERGLPSKPNDAPPDDELARLTPMEAAAFYRRLAKIVQEIIPASLASKMLLHWLDGKGGFFRFDASYVKDVKYVNDYLRDRVRPVFLTEKRAELKEGKKWAGILPRIKDPSWDGKSIFRIHYEGPSVEIPLSVQMEAMLGRANEAELDLLMSLHAFGIKTDVIMSATPVPGTTKYNVKFESWQSQVFDKYDWNPKKHITVPNPDYQNHFNVAKPVAPNLKSIKVYHSNAKRVEEAKLATPYDAESTPWQVTSQEIVGPAIVDASRKL